MCGTPEQPWYREDWLHQALDHRSVQLCKKGRKEYPIGGLVHSSLTGFTSSAFTARIRVFLPRRHQLPQLPISAHVMLSEWRQETTLGRRL